MDLIYNSLIAGVSMLWTRLFKYFQSLPSVDQERTISHLHNMSDIIKWDEIPTIYDKYKVGPDIFGKISVFKGDITKIECDKIVNAANTRLNGGGGVDGAIHKAAGFSELYAETRKFFGCAVGDAVETSACNMKHVKNIIHAVGPKVTGKLDANHMRLLEKAYESCFEFVNDECTVAFPCISTGVFNFPNEKAATNALYVALKACSKPGKVKRVIFVTFLDVDYDIYHKEIADIAKFMEENPTKEPIEWRHEKICAL